VIVRAALRARDDGSRDLVILVEPLGVERVVARIAPEHRCLTETRHEEVFVDTFLGVGCGLARRVVVTTTDPPDHSLVIAPVEGAPSTVPLPEGATVRYRHELDDPASGKGCEGAAARPASISPSIAVRVTNPAEPTLSRSFFFLVDEFRVALPIGELHHSLCEGRLDPHLKRFVATCSFSESSSYVEAKVTGDGLLFATGQRSYEGNSREVLGGFRLPCGARVQFPSLHRLDPGFNPTGGMCSTRCGMAGDLCEDRCLARYPEREREEGPGADCLQRCHLQVSDCIARCPR
jgi:hypothetical protein